MKKNKILLTVVNIIMSLSIATNVVGAETINTDTLYKNAYIATQKSLTQRTQSSVNEARAEIKKLPKKLSWAIGEFSKQIDTIQHPIFVNIVNSIKTADKTLTQVDIDKANDSIPAELNTVFKNSYSSAVDKIQQKLQVRALDLVKKAEGEKTQAAVDNALVVINDLKKSKTPGLAKWANILLGKVNSIVVVKPEVKPEDPGTGNGGTVTKPTIPVETKRNVKITSLDLNKEIVTIKNNETKDINMTGWKLVSVVGPQTYKFPNGYILKAGSTITIASGKSTVTLKWTGTYIWNDDGDKAELYDASNNLISEK